MDQNLKKKLFIAVACCIGCYAMFVLNTYTIENNDRDIKTNLTEMVKRNNTLKEESKDVQISVNAPFLKKQENPMLE